MLARRFALLALSLSVVLIPTLASAQRGGGGMGGRGGRRGGGGDNSAAKSANAGLSNGDLEDISPIKLLIDKRKDLKLSDAQVKQFKDLESAMKKKNEHFFKALDSLRDDMKPRGGTPSDGERARVINARQRFGDTVDSIRTNYDATLEQATALLDDTQKKAAAALIMQQNLDAEVMLNDKLRGRGVPPPGPGTPLR